MGAVRSVSVQSWHEYHLGHLDAMSLAAHRRVFLPGLKLLCYTTLICTRNFPNILPWLLRSQMVPLVS